MPTDIKTKFRELNANVLEFSKGLAHRISEALGRFSPFQDNKLTFREVEIPKERAEFLQGRADYWSHAMGLHDKGIDPPKLQFHEGLQASGKGMGTYWVETNVIAIDADVATSNYMHLDTLIAHEVGHCKDLENILREGLADNTFTKSAILAGLVIGGACAAAISTQSITVGVGLISGLILGLSASKLREFWLYYPICLPCETRANKNALNAGMSRDELLQMYDSWRNPDGTPCDEYAEVILNAIVEYEGEPR